ncbi:MAG: NAD-dependent deacylase [Bacteroidetes bacterium]|nr:NAD-dependent deacylase [Bacteroidota bacterium]
MKKIVVFTGAGMSAESGIQTFRDSGGLWEGHKVEEVATPRAWQRDPEKVLRFYNERRRNILQAQPNAAHIAIADLQKSFDVEIITQNIDDLHERAGSKKILHLHGEIFKMRSEANETLIYPILDDMKVGDLAEDGAQLRPHIVWFEEPVPMMEKAILMSHDADLFVVIGSSLVVYPAASLVHYLPPFMPVYVIDKKVPKIDRRLVTYIEKPATEGVKELVKLLSKV